MDIKEFNVNGGLTLVPMPGFKGMVRNMKELIQNGEGKRIGHKTDVDIAYPEFGYRSQGEPMLELGKPHIDSHDCVVVASGPMTWTLFGQLQLLMAYLHGRRAKRIAILFGYFPWSRSDKDEGETVFALTKFVVDQLIAASYGKLDRIMCVNPHSAGISQAGPMGFVTGISMARRVYATAYDEAMRVNPNANIVALLPDDGAGKAFEGGLIEFAEKRGIILPRVYGTKRRVNSHKAELTGLHGDLDALKGSHVISLDDEIATGGTNCGGAEFVIERFGVEEFWAAAPHGVLSRPSTFTAPDSPITRLIVSDTIPIAGREELIPLLESGNLTVVPWIKHACQATLCHHWGKTIRNIR